MDQYDYYDDVDDENIFDSPPPPIQGSRPDALRSPWNSSQDFATNLSLTLPSLTPGDLAENPALHRRLPSPGFLLRRPSTSASQARESWQPQITAQPRQPSPVTRNISEVYPGSNFAFDDFINTSGPPSPLNAYHTGDSSIIDLTESSPQAMATNSRKRKASPSVSMPSVKRGRDETLSNSSPTQPKTRFQSLDIEELDLVHVNDNEAYRNYQSQTQAEALKLQRQEEADKPIKLSAFQCIICLDNPTDLTVTFCGHLFCSVCLHEALHAGTNQKKSCPVCRQVISLTKSKDKKNGETKVNQKGFYPLSMKLMTRKKGKQPERVFKC